MDPYLGQIKLFPFAYAPQDWALCDGRQLPIQQNAALYSLLGTFYGGDGKTYFNLPDLRGRVPVHPISPAPASLDRINAIYGKQNGAEAVALNTSQLPAHTHQVNGENSLGASTSPIGGSTCLWSIPADSTKKQAAANPFSTTPNVQMDASAIITTGGGLGHDNMQPFLVLNYCIAIVGIYPTRP